MQRGNYPLDMDDRWWIVVAGHTVEFTGFWTGKLIFEARVGQVGGEWAIDRAWVTAPAADAEDTAMLADVLGHEVRDHFREQ